MKPRSGNYKQKERGQSFVELGISMMFLLILLATVIELGWVLFTMIAMRDSAQEGASFASLCQNTKMITSRMQDSATAPLDISDIEDFKIEYIDSDGEVNGMITYGYTVRATLTVQHQLLVPFVGSFIGNKGSLPLTVDATDTIMQLDTICAP